MNLKDRLLFWFQLHKYPIQTNLINSRINKITAEIGIMKLTQSDDDPFGLFFIIWRADGRRITIKAINAKAETICIQSILIHLVKLFVNGKKQNPGQTGVLFDDNLN